MKSNAVILREIKLIIGKKGNFLHIIVLFIAIFSFSVFALRQDVSGIFFQIVSICSIFTLQTSMYHLFESDYADGSLEQIFIYSNVFEVVVTAKILAHWLCFGLPIAIISAFFHLVVMKNGSFLESVYLGLAIASSTIIVTFISATSSSLILGQNNATAISQLLILPMIIPAFIYSDLFWHKMCNANYDSNFLLFSLAMVVVIIISVLMASLGVKIAIEHD